MSKYRLFLLLLNLILGISWCSLLVNKLLEVVPEGINRSKMVPEPTFANPEASNNSGIPAKESKILVEC